MTATSITPKIGVSMSSVPAETGATRLAARRPTTASGMIRQA